MYESPIRLLVQQLETSVREQQEKQIFEAIQKCGVDIDRAELIKALAYDRDQYDKGYTDGRADAQRWISVEERLPKELQYVLAINQYDDDSFEPCIAYFRAGQWFHGSYMGGDITYWMLLPQPPKEE